ncbi:carbamoylphosphate synthase large subunit [Paenibacillus sp. MBLB4367]|uniref:carbamoylphosphate synthase large subunit n=1 Tax=Paenibacillus sp. MBLB4367 TaxID=3384767 RepID=UPI003907FB1B
MTTDARTVLLTGGRAPVTLDLARQLASAGHRVIVADSMPNNLAGASKHTAASYAVPPPNREPAAYIEALERIVRKERVDLLIPMCEEIFYVSQGLDRLSAYCRVFAEPIEKLRALHSKWAFIRQTAEWGFTVPRTRLLTGRHELEALLQAAEAEAKDSGLGVNRYAADGRPQERLLPLVLKPVYSRFAANVIVLEAGDLRKQGWQALAGRLDVSAARPWVAQQFVGGRQVCTYSVAREGAVAAHAAYGADFTAGRGACISFRPLDMPAVADWVERFVRQARFTGQIAFDFIVDGDGGIWPLECNPRATSGIHLFRARDRLDRAFMQTGPDPATDVELRQTRLNGGEAIVPQQDSRSMIGLAMLSYGLASVRSRRRLGEWARTFGQASDVVLRLSDPLPFLEQFRTLWSTWRESRKQGVTMLSASTMDIEWNGD